MLSSLQVLEQLQGRRGVKGKPTPLDSFKACAKLAGATCSCVHAPSLLDLEGWRNAARRLDSLPQLMRDAKKRGGFDAMRAALIAKPFSFRFDHVLSCLQHLDVRVVKMEMAVGPTGVNVLVVPTLGKRPKTPADARPNRPNATEPPNRPPPSPELPSRAARSGAGSKLEASFDEAYDTIEAAVEQVTALEATLAAAKATAAKKQQQSATALAAARTRAADATAQAHRPLGTRRQRLLARRVRLSAQITSSCRARCSNCAARRSGMPPCWRASGASASRWQRR